MAKRAGDARTIDLFKDYQPAPVVERFSEDSVKAWNPQGRLSKAVGLTLDESDMSRPEIAKAMSDLLKEEVSRHMLDAYASQARDNQISALRLMALVMVTGDARALNTLLADADMIVVPAKYEALLRRERAKEMKERAEREEQAAEAEWRARK